MSVQFGRWNFDGEPIAPRYVEGVKTLLAPYGPDGQSSYANEGVRILYHAFHTTREARQETQPYISHAGCVITWDGRLDNRTELGRELSDVLPSNPSDVEIASAAWNEWGEKSFARLQGDWALVILNLSDRSAILAKDPIGTRHLHYSLENSRVTWCTVLDPLALLAGQRFRLSKEYIAGWLSFFPATHLTPYVGIHSVPPSCLVRVKQGKCEVRKYWDFDSAKQIRYRTDAEYEEQFRFLFRESVRRRLRSDDPVLAELSGGMDSSSIVCMADTILAAGTGEAPRLDTISYYDDSEPNWNERPYFTKIEKMRGRAGWHIDASHMRHLQSEFDRCAFSAVPGLNFGAREIEREFSRCLLSQGNRVVLSGIGGDETTGGVPTPVPELADLAAAAQFRALAHALKVWALEKRKPWLHLLFATARAFLPGSVMHTPRHKRPVAWLHASFARRYRTALTGYEQRMKLFGPKPSFQIGLATVEALRRQIQSAAPSRTVYEKRYPYLDRDLLEFLLAVPCEQIVRPGQRRSLMRRALVSIVPDEVLNRRRKAFAIRSPITAIANSTYLFDGNRTMIASSLGIVDESALIDALAKARRGDLISTVALTRTLALEAWLLGVFARTVPDGDDPLSVSFAIGPIARDSPEPEHRSPQLRHSQ